MRLSDFLKKLPHTKPLLAKNLLQGWQFVMFDRKYVENKPSRAKVKVDDEITLKIPDMEEILCELERYTPHIVTPYGAGILIQLYTKGHLPMKKASPGEVPAELIEYAKSGERAVTLRERLRKEQESAAQARRAKLLDLAGTKPSEFGYSLLNDIFFLNMGPGSGTLEIGGVKVTKTLHVHRSNSGKSSDCEVTFTWSDPDGAPREITKPSAYAGNRRNDADRNWGLPE